MDTGDTILHKPSRERHMVACVHSPYLHTAGFPELRLLLIDCTLIREATAEERHQHTVSMARSSGTGHRSVCARQRLGGDYEHTENGC
jgi:hypothetical protein